jgi:chromosome segregation ATPase
MSNQSNLSNLVNELQKKLTEKTLQIKNLEDMLKSAERKIKARDSRSEQASAVGPMADLVKDLQRKLKVKEEEIERLRTAIGSKAASSDRFSEVDQLKVQVSDLSANITEFKRTIDGLQKLLSQKEQLILGLQDEIKLLKDQSRGGALPSGDHSTLAEENRVLSDKLTKAWQQIQYLSDDLARKNQDILLLQQDRSKDAVEVVQKERDTLKASFQTMEAKLATMQKEQEEGGTHQQMLRFRELHSMLDSMKRQIRLQNQELNEVKKKIITV